MVIIRDETPSDLPARERILEACFGPGRSEKTSERLREGRRPARGLALVAEAGGRVVGTVRLWPVQAGTAGRALLLGPLAVDCGAQGSGIGGALMRAALRRARARGHGAVLLVGDAPYYERFGFSADLTTVLTLPGPCERERFLALELAPGSLDDAQGPVRPAGERTLRPAFGAEARALAA